MDNQNKSNKNFTPLPVLFGLVIITLSCFFYETNNGATINSVVEQKVETPKFDTVSLETKEYANTFKLKRLTEKYDTNGKLTYIAIFESSSHDYIFECEIPEKFGEQLSNEAIYTGNLEITFMKEYYQLAINNKEYSDLELALKFDNGAREISNITFMYSEYLTTELKTTDKIHEELSEKYLKQ